MSLKKAEDQAEFADLSADVAVVAAYGLILPPAVLDAPTLGCINVHASLLPRWRGAAPIQRAILAGDKVTGVTIMQMEMGLDTGPMLLKRDMPIDRLNAGQLTDALAKLGAEAMIDWLSDPERFLPEPQPESRVTYAAKVDKAEARIDWNDPAIDIERQVRAFEPKPGAWFEHAGERVKILAAEAIDDSGAPGEVLDDRLTTACGEGALRPLTVQRPGRAAMSPDEMLRGFTIPAGTQLQ